MKPRFGTVRALVAIASGIWASSASADGYLPPAGYPAPMFVSWTGLYVGGHIGGAWSDVDWANVDFTVPGEPGVFNTTGFIGGVQVGYNHQFGKILLGLEATYSGTTLNDGFVSVVDPNVTYNDNINDIVTVTGRLGVALDRWLMYAKGGWAGAQVVVSGHIPPIPSPSPTGATGGRLVAALSTRWHTTSASERSTALSTSEVKLTTAQPRMEFP